MDKLKYVTKILDYVIVVLAAVLAILKFISGGMIEGAFWSVVMIATIIRLVRQHLQREE